MRFENLAHRFPPDFSNDITTLETSKGRIVRPSLPLYAVRVIDGSVRRIVRLALRLDVTAVRCRPVTVCLLEPISRRLHPEQQLMSCRKLLPAGGGLQRILAPEVVWRRRRGLDPAHGVQSRVAR